MKRSPIFITAMLSAFLVCGCAGGGVKPYHDLDSAKKLERNPDRRDTLVYKKYGVEGKKYGKFLFEPTQVYQGTDEDFYGAEPEDKQAMAAFVDAEFRRVLAGKYEIVAKPGPGVMRVKFTVVGMEVTSPVAATASHLIPLGLAVNVIKGVAGMQGSYMGSVSLAGEFYDGESNDLLYAFVTKRGPNALNVTEMFTGLAAARSGVTDLAEKFLETVDRIHGKGKAAR